MENISLTAKLKRINPFHLPNTTASVAGTIKLIYLIYHEPSQILTLAVSYSTLLIAGRMDYKECIWSCPARLARL